MDLRKLQTPFRILGDYVSAAPYGSGHINDTFAAVYQQAGTSVRYIHQRINENIFTDVPGLMANIQKVTCHIQKKLVVEGCRDRTRRGLILLPTSDDHCYYTDEEGKFWRTYLFIENAQTYDRTGSLLQAREAGRAFGLFQSHIADLPFAQLRETIPDFHDTRMRFEALKAAIELDPLGRVSQVGHEIDWFLRRESIVDVINSGLADGSIPRRVAHNDTKINNVMLDNETFEGVCVIDLDTVMPGSSLFDFGDMVRSITNTADEDEKNIQKVGMDFSYFQAILDGYMSAACTFLTEVERDLLAFSGKLITYEIGCRFLTDFLLGDVYFKKHYSDHNLIRSRVHIAMVESIEKQMDAMQNLVQDKASCVY